MSSRKRRSNRLTEEQFGAKRENRERELNQQVMLIGYSQTELKWYEADYRTVSLGVAQQLVRDGEAKRYIEQDPVHGALVIFRELKPIAGTAYCLPTMPNAKSADALSQYTPSARLSGAQRRRVANVLMFPFDRDTKAPLALPRVTEHDRQRALQILGVRAATAGHCYRDTRVLRNELAAAA